MPLEDKKWYSFFRLQLHYFWHLFEPGFKFFRLYRSIVWIHVFFHYFIFEQKNHRMLWKVTMGCVLMTWFHSIRMRRTFLFLRCTWPSKQCFLFMPLVDARVFLWMQAWRRRGQYPYVKVLCCHMPFNDVIWVAIYWLTILSNSWRRGGINADHEKSHICTLYSVVFGGFHDSLGGTPSRGQAGIVDLLVRFWILANFM